MTKIGINGFGRIGRLILRALLENYKDKIQVVGNLTLYNLDKIKNILDKEKLLLKNNLPDKKLFYLH